MLSPNSEPVSVLRGTPEACRVHVEDRGVTKAGHHASSHDAHAESDICPQVKMGKGAAPSDCHHRAAAAGIIWPKSNDVL